MGLVGWIMLFVHAGLFVYLRKHYIGKKNVAEKRCAAFEVQNIELKSKLADYQEIFGENGDQSE